MERCLCFPLTTSKIISYALGSTIWRYHWPRGCHRHRAPGQLYKRVLISSNLGITTSKSVCLKEDLDSYLIYAEWPGASHRNPSGFQFPICRMRMRRLTPQGHLLADQPTSPGSARPREVLRASSPSLSRKRAPGHRFTGRWFIPRWEISISPPSQPLRITAISSWNWDSVNTYSLRFLLSF